MNRSLSYLVPTTIALFTFILFSATKCSSDDDQPEEPDKCGILVEDYVLWDTEDLKPEDHYLYIDEGYACYDYSAGLIEDVCAYKHVNGTFNIGINQNYSSVILYSCEVTYGILYAYPVMDFDVFEYDPPHIMYKGYYEFGMQHLYENEPGWFLPVCTVMIRDQGSTEENNEMFRNAIDVVSIEYAYYKYKALD